MPDEQSTQTDQTQQTHQTDQGVRAEAADGPPNQDPAAALPLAHRRWTALARASQAITAHTELPVVLRRIVEEACALVGARYGALGVIGDDGTLEEFVHHGMDPATAEAIGHLPKGLGLLGALIVDPHPIRLADLTADERSAGFPAGHPAMRSFLGVPIRIGETAFGNLYLTESASGEFSAEDEELVTALTGLAAIAIENARLFGRAERRQRWLTASTEVTRQLLSQSGEEPLRLIARSVRELSDADVATVVLPTADRSRFMVEVATGPGADRLTALSYPAAGSLAELAMSTGQPVLLGNVEEQHEYEVHLLPVIDAGPVMVLPLAGSGTPAGALFVARLRGRRRFSPAGLEMATTFANHAAIALELADARADQQRVVLLEDRDRIARDLHDHVIQRLFAAGLTVQSVQSGLPDTDGNAGRLARVVDDLDDTIRQIRTSIFQLRGPLVPRGPSVRQRLLDIVSDMTPLLGFQPDVRFSGAIDLGVEDRVMDDLAAVLREALSNVARHARARHVGVEVGVQDGHLSIDVVDDGVGIGDGQRRSGLHNLRMRAERNRGSLILSTPAVKGTHLRWTIPLGSGQLP